MNDMWKKLTTVFKATLIFYLVCILNAVIRGTFEGIDSGWAMPAMSSGEKMYGIDAIQSYLIITVFGYYYVFVPIVIFQVIYIIAAIVRKIKGKNKKER